MRKNTMMGHAALLILCAGLSACSVPGSTDRGLNEQAAWASNLGIDRNRPQATAALPGPDGKVRLTAGELKPIPQPPVPAPVVVAPAPVAAPAAPVAAVSAAQAAPDSERREVLTEILAWRKAWVEGDAGSYISHYAPSFQGELTSRSAWEKQRRERLASRDIAVKIIDLTVRMVDGVALAEFEQRYTSKKHEDVGTKTMKLRKINGKWLIIDEKWRKA